MGKSNNLKAKPFDLEDYKDEKIWEKHPNEPHKGYTYFVTYRDMGVSRTLEKTGAIYGLSLQGMEYYSKSNHWVKRAKAYDAYLLNELEKEKVKALKAMTRNHISSMRAATTALMIPIKELLKRYNNGTIDFDKLTEYQLFDIVNRNAGTLTKVVDTERVVNEQPNTIIKNEFGESAPEIILALPQLTDRLKERIDKKYEELEDSENETSD